MAVYDNPTEFVVFEKLICGYVGSVLRAANRIPADKWDWSFVAATPSAREICEHTFMWLWCDRQQINVLDRTQHVRTPDLPLERDAMLAMLQEEGEAWRDLIQSLTPEMLEEEREPWPGEIRNLRGFLYHASQHVVFKAGQIWVLVYGLGLDGPDPYRAPYPDYFYEFADAPPWPSPRR